MSIFPDRDADFDNPRSKNQNNPVCPLCSHETSDKPDPFKLHNRFYHTCPNCDLIFMDPHNILPPTEEVKRYNYHQNSIRNEGYEGFLNRLILPVLEESQNRWENERKTEGIYSGPRITALDFGSGPYPMLAELMAERGISMELYDPFYSPRDLTQLENGSFQLITCCEVAEHFHTPLAEFSVLNRLLSPEGFLAIMTGIRYPDIRFSTWHYSKDDTHTSFYSPTTLEWIARTFSWKVTFPGKNLAFFWKNGADKTISVD